MPLSTAGQAAGLSDAERLRLLIDAVTDYAIYMLDPDGFIVSWNPGAERVTGYRSFEIIGQHFSRFFTDEHRAEGLPGRMLERATSTGRCEQEGLRLRKEGTRFRASSVIEKIADSTDTLIGFAEITRDITERVAAQEALLESERRFRLLVDGVLDYAIYMLDPSGIITNWNAGGERLKGYSAEEAIGQHFSRFYTKEDRAAGLPVRTLDTAAREGRYEDEGWRVRKDGSRFWASVVIDAVRTESGELLGFAKITRDITERRNAQEALQQSERQLRLFVRGVTDYALFMLDPNGVVTSWNPGAERIKGYTADEIIGQHFSRFYTEHERSAGLPARALYMAAQQGGYEAEGWRVRKDGSLFWANAVINPIRDEHGTLVGFAKITRDMTDRREAQLALQESQAQRAHTQKMEALGQLTGGVAHDFNNLLMIVGGYIPMIKKVVAHDAAAMRAAEAIELAARRGESLTRQLLSFSRRQTLNPAAVDLRERLEALSKMMASSLGPATTIAVNIFPEIWPVQVDVNELELALMNVALNARDAMPQGGLIAINGENVRLSGQHAPGDLEGDFVELAIADTGCGIPADILPRVCEPFFTTKEPSRGTGLGLSQVYGFAHQSGGTVTVSSDLGKGTTIKLYLPRAVAQPQSHEASTAIDASPGASTAIDASPGGLALLVEDNPEVAEVTLAMLAQLGYRVHAERNAVTALQSLERGNFDLVVSDILMAGPMDGLALAGAVRKSRPALPVLLVSGYSQAAASAAAEFVVLRKPFQLAELSRAVASAIARAQPAPKNLVHLRDSRRRPKTERP